MRRFLFAGTSFCATVFAVCALAVCAPAVADEGEESHELIEAMGGLQYFLHKTGLALREGNFNLASFYLHEIEEVLAEVSEVESYGGHPVGKMSAAMMTEAFETLEKAVKNGKRKASRRAYADVIQACNTCHVATEHGFIKVKDRSGRNPFMQSFGK